MPELPEVESVARDMRNADPPFIGSIIKSVDLPWKGIVKDIDVDNFLSIVTDRSITSVSRYGKYLFLGLSDHESEIFLAMHLRMTGIIYLTRSGQAADLHNRLSIHLDSGIALRFDDPRKFGRVWLVDNPAAVSAGLGPDALTVDVDEFVHRLKNTSRQLKAILLDQSFVAGIGNIYADESLFLAGLNPLQKSSLLSNTDIITLHDSVIAVLMEAVAANGANIEGVFKAGNYAVKAYGRQGKPCFKCGNKIVKIRVGQRGTHYCPVCQPLLPV